MIDLTAADGHKFQAYQAGAQTSPRALVVVQEIFGVNPHMRAVADRLAASGYYVLSPAIFDRAERHVELEYTQDGVKKGLELRAAIDEADVMRDIEACAASLSPRPTGIIGYCWGGTIAWMAATHSKNFKAASGWYGGGIVATKEATPNCPVQLHFGALDQGIPLTDVEAIKQAHPEIPVFLYDNADHGFGCEDRASYNAEANKLAETRSLEFFAKNLVWPQERAMNALLVIDVQGGMFADPAMQPHDGEAVVQRIAKLIDAARHAGSTVIFVQHEGGEGDPLESGTPGFALRPELAPLAGETIIAKRHCSAFQDTDLSAILAKHALKALAVCGMQTEYCIDTTCRSAYERGFAVTLISDAHTTFDSAIIPASAIIRHHNATLGAGFATVTSAYHISFGVELSP